MLQRILENKKKKQLQTIGEFKKHISRDKKKKRKDEKKKNLPEIFVVVLSH